MKTTHIHIEKLPALILIIGIVFSALGISGAYLHCLGMKNSAQLTYLSVFREMTENIAVIAVLFLFCAVILYFDIRSKRKE